MPNAHEAIIRLLIDGSKDEARRDLASVIDNGTFDREQFATYVHPLRELSEDEFNRFVEQRNAVWFTDRAVEPFATLTEATAYINSEQPDEDGTRIELQQLDNGRWRVSYMLDLPNDPDWEADGEGALRQLARAVHTAADYDETWRMNANALAHAVMKLTAEEPELGEPDSAEPYAHIWRGFDWLIKHPSRDVYEDTVEVVRGILENALGHDLIERVGIEQRDYLQSLLEEVEEVP